MNVIFAMVQLL